MYYFNYMSMTPEERKTYLILMGIFLIISICYGIYCFFKNNDKKQ